MHNHHSRDRCHQGRMGTVASTHVQSNVMRSHETLIHVPRGVHPFALTRVRQTNLRSER